MIARCHRPSCEAFPNYGARGIRVCDRWRAGFEAFLADVGPRPSPKHSLDRINNDGNYEPGNVRWATRSQQLRNKRDTRRMKLNGQVVPMIEVSAALGIPHHRFYTRLYHGWHLFFAALAPGRVAGVRVYGPVGERRAYVQKVETLANGHVPVT